jgi:MFS family permease
MMHFLHSINLHALRPIVSLYVDSIGASEFVVGILFSVYAFFPMLIAIQVGKWVDKLGTWKMALFGGLVSIISILVPILLSGLGPIFFLQIFVGLSQLFIIVSLQKTIGSFPGDRDKTITSMTFFGSMGGLVGPLISGYSYDLYGFTFSLWIILATSFVALLMGIFIGRERWNIGKKNEGTTLGEIKIEERRIEEGNTCKTESRLGVPEEPSSWKLLKNVKLRNALIVGGLVLYSKDLFVAFFPIYASSLGLTPSKIGILLSISAGTSMIIRLAQFWLVHRFGRGTILFVTLLISGFCFILIPFSSTAVLLALVVGVLGGGLGLGQPLSLVYAMKVSPEKREGEVLGIRLTINRASQFVAPLAFGAIGSLFGILPIFWASGGVLLLGAFFTRGTPQDIKKD